MNANIPVQTSNVVPADDINAKRFVREATVSKETKGTFKFDEEVQNDMSVFRSIYLEKWTQVRNHNRIRVTIELLPNN
jgi:hypothetical protein